MPPEARLRALVEKWRLVRYGSLARGYQECANELDAALLGDASRPSETEKHEETDQSRVAPSVPRVETTGSTAERRTGAVTADERTDDALHALLYRIVTGDGQQLENLAMTEDEWNEGAGIRDDDESIEISITRTDWFDLIRAAGGIVLQSHESRSPDGDGQPQSAGAASGEAECLPYEAQATNAGRPVGSSRAEIKHAADGSEPSDSLSTLATGDASRPPETDERPKETKP